LAIIVKRRGKKEKFDEKKLYASVYSACMECDIEVRKAEKVAEETILEVRKFLHGRKSINSTELFGFVIQKLARHHEAVAFMYETHREIAV